MTEKKVFTVGPSESGRLDAFVARKMTPLVSRSKAQDLIAQGQILVDGKRAKSAYRVCPGDAVTVSLPPRRENVLSPQKIPLDIVYEDAQVFVVNKERGMVVHPGAGNFEGTLANAILWRYPELKGVGTADRPGIVHRLDKDTTGLLIAAKTQDALEKLQGQIRRNEMKRQYVVLAKGRFKRSSGTIDAPLGRNPYNRKKMAVVASGRKAMTDFEVLKSFDDSYSLILAKLKTGRTHQIRVHLAYIGHPVAGDMLYGGNKGEMGLLGQALHSAILGFYKPRSGEYLEFKASPPPDFLDALERLSQQYEEEIPEWIMSRKKL